MTDLLGPASSYATTERPTDDRTFGSADTWAKDCTSESIKDGTKIKAGWLNAILANLRSAIRGMGITETANGDNMLRSALFAARLRGATASGTASALTVAFTPAYAGYADTMSFLVTAAVESAAGGLTINVDGLGAKPVYLNGEDPPAGAIGPGRYVLVHFDDDALHVVAPGTDAVTMPEARARLPIWPECQTGDGKVGVFAPSVGTVRVPAGVTILHRGIYPVVTAETDFATAASKTYHLRWSAAAGWALKDLASGTYNPGALAESNAGFDSTYDDMLAARIVTNDSNVATITNLINLPRLITSATIEAQLSDALDWTALASSGVSLDWARTPQLAEPALQMVKSWEAAVDGNRQLTSAVGTIKMLGLRKSASATRYAVPNLEYVYEDSVPNLGRMKAVWSVLAL